MHNSQQIIDEIIEALSGENTTSQKLYFIREMLRSLVRLVRLEYAEEVKKAVIMLQSNPYAEFNAEESSDRITKRLMADLQSKHGRLD